jgi:hypothetical protein
MTKGPAHSPTFFDAVLRLFEASAITRDKVVRVNVGHDDCGMLTGPGICSCKPLVTVRRDAA